MREEICWLNGELLPVAKARISPHDRGLLYGDGLFETMRAYGGVIFRLDQHLDRLSEGTLALRFPVEVYTGNLAEGCREVVRANSLSDAYVRLTVTRGEGGLPSELAATDGPTGLITAREFHGYPAEMATRGMTAHVASVTRNATSPLSRVKSLNYLDNALARAEATDAGADEALLRDASGHVVEGSSSNLFAVVDGTVRTPPVDAGVLAGITRDCVLELCADLALPVSETLFDAEELLASGEAFLTNSLMEVMPLVAADGRPIGDGAPGPVTTRLQEAYRALVERETDPDHPYPSASAGTARSSRSRTTLPPTS